MRNDIIEESSSDYASPVVMVSKKDGSFRMCVDYRMLNQVIQREYFPTRNIEEEIAKLHGCGVFTSLDLMSGYHQIEVEESSRKYTAFVTPDGHYQYKRVPFGLANSPAVFMRLMSKLMSPFKGKGITFFMDDVLIATQDVTSNLRLLEQFLIQLKGAGLTLKLDKCEFLMEEVTYLGYQLNSHGTSPGDLKTEVIKQFPRPHNKTAVRQFLGLTGYFRRFVPGYGEIAKPLTSLLKKDSSGNEDVDNKWGNSEERAFQTLKAALTCKPVLAIYNPDLEHEVHCDASSFGIAGVLIQVNKEGMSNPVMYYSKATEGAEINYASHELETLAVVRSLEKFKYYLLNKHFTVYTDCRSLAVTKASRELTPRVARWWMSIQEFSFDLKFRKGSQMQHADCLSRNLSKAAKENNDLEIMALSLSNSDWVAALQCQDDQLLRIRKVLEGLLLKEEDEVHIRANFKLEDGRIFYKTLKGWRFVVPRGARWSVIHGFHDEMGHPGVDKTVQSVSEHYYFDHLRSFVNKYIKNCIPCAENKRGSDETKHQLHCVPKEPIPFHTIHIDHCGPYIRSKKRNEYIVGIIDAFTRFIVLRAVRSADSKGVQTVLSDISQYFGMPNIVLTDRGSAFTSKAFKEFCDTHDIKHSLISAKTPRANGQIERYFRFIGEALKCYCTDDDERNWDAHLTQIQWGLNSMKNGTTNESPQKLLLGYQPKNILGNKFLNAISSAPEKTEEESDVQTLRKKAEECMNKKQREQAEKYNRTHVKPRVYNKGDLVLLRFESPASGTSRKLTQRFRGPYIVDEVLGADRYRVKDTPATQVTAKPFDSVYPAEHMKFWGQLPDEDYFLAEEKDEN